MNKLFKYLKLPALALMVLCIAACGDGLEDLNVDPNNPTAIPASNLVTQAQFSYFNEMQSRSFNGEWAMLMVQHWAQNEYAEESRYTVDGNSFDGNWTRFYSSILNELAVAKSLIQADGSVVGGRKANQLAIIDIMSAITYQALTEAFGDIPFTQAVNQEFPNPAYDGQETVWMGILNSLDAAVGSMDTGAGSFESGDVVFAGDAASWKRLGASLLLRAAMRVSDRDAGLAGGFVTKALGYGVLSSNAENGIFAFSTDPALANPLYVDRVINTRDDFAVTDVLVDALTNMGDPRLAMFANVTNSGTIVGMPYGLTDPEAFALKDGTSRPSDGVRDAQSPHIIMDFAEVSFLMAEAIEKGMATGNAADHYANGVTASMNFWGITDQAAIDAYIAANAYDAANWKQSVGMQKWIAFYSSGTQAWAEWRRLDVPSLAVPVAATNAGIPVRLPYPVSEQERNGTSLGAVTNSPNDMNTKLWWDVN